MGKKIDTGLVYGIGFLYDFYSKHELNQAKKLFTNVDRKVMSKGKLIIIVYALCIKFLNASNMHAINVSLCAELHLVDF